jgi:hypothetical protein
MKVYNYTPEGIYRDSEEAVESPLENGVFLIPAGATNIKPPEAREGFHAVWNGTEWNIVAIPEKLIEESETNKTLLDIEDVSPDILN